MAARGRRAMPCAAMARAVAALACAVVLAATTQGCQGSAAASAPAAVESGAARRGRCSAMRSHGGRMDCGAGVALCGVLALEMGSGSGAYRHSEPVVHGLWPQVGHYGSSRCMSPRAAGPPDELHSCYDQSGVPRSRSLSFQRHEWERHGVCAGASDADDFFQQVCALSSGPLRVLAGARAAGLDATDASDQLQRSGYCVWSVGSQAQVELSACAGADGRWKLADVSDFARVCGAVASPPQEVSAPVCVPNRHGPKCDSDAQCQGLAGCMRCAHSGFCTDVGLSLLSARVEGLGARTGASTRAHWAKATVVLYVVLALAAAGCVGAYLRLSPKHARADGYVVM